MKCNTGVKWVKYLAIFSENHCLPRLLFYQPIMFPNTIILHRIFNVSFSPLMPGGNKRSYLLKQTCNCLLQNQCFSTIFSNTVIKTDNTPLFLGLQLYLHIEQTFLYQAHNESIVDLLPYHQYFPLKNTVPYQTTKKF